MHLHVSVLGDHPQGAHCNQMITTQCTHKHTEQVNTSTSFNLTSTCNIQHDALVLHHHIVNTYILDFAHDSIDVPRNSEPLRMVA